MAASGTAPNTAIPKHPDSGCLGADACLSRDLNSKAHVSWLSLKPHCLGLNSCLDLQVE